MAKPDQTSKRQSKPTGKLSTIFSWIINIFLIILGSAFFSVIIELVGVLFNLWSLPGYYHAKDMFDTELNWVLGDFLSVSSFYQSQFIHLFETAYYWLIRSSGLEYLSHLEYFGDYVLATIYILQVVVIRMIVILCAIPAFVMINIVLFAHGLYIRQIRKVSAAPESAYIYHHAKRWIKPLVGLPIIILLALPFSIHPSMFVLIVSLVPGFFIWLSVAYFKKYL